MAETTQSKKAPSRQARPRRSPLGYLLILAAVLALVLAAAYRGGTGMDVLRRRLSYGRAQTGEIRYNYDPSAKNRFAPLGSRLAVLSDVSLSLLDDGGGEIWSTPVNMANPAMVRGGDRAAAFDVGGQTLYVLDESGCIFTLTTGENEPILSASLNGRGMLAVTWSMKGSKGCISVYNESMEKVFDFTSRQRFVEDACLTEDGQYLAAVTLGQQEGVFVSSILLYDITQQDPIASVDVAGGLAFSTGQLGDSLAAVTDAGLAFASVPGGKITASYSYGGAYLRDYDLGGDGFAVLLLNRYQSGNVGRLVSLDESGRELGSLDIQEEIRDISAAGKYLAVLYTDSLVVYNQDLQVYASLRGVDAASGVLMRQDGTALLLSGGSAKLFLP